MKIFPFLLLLILLLPCAKAEELEFNPQEAGYLEADIEFVSFIGSTGKLSELNHSVYIIPESYSSLEFEGEGEHTYSIGEDEFGNKKMEIFWEDFTPQSYKVSMKVRNSAKFNGPGKVKFPYNPPQELFEHLAESKYVVITDGIREKAAEVVKGSSDGFEAVTRISTWVFSNVEYDLSYSGSIYSSSEVYDERRGTCDEFTNLFLAMCRSVGIPARYVAGIIYSKEGWGYHAWAEVYLGKWVPVDPTWNEIGWLDATHIEFGKFPDGGDVKVTASYLSDEKEEVQISQPEPSVSLLSLENMGEVFSTDFQAYPKTIGLGESSVLTIKTTSSSQGCLATSLRINPRVDSSGKPIISIEGKEIISICPGETKESHFIITSNESLDRGYTYYNLADIYTFLGDQKTIDLEINPGKDDYSKLYLTLNSQTAEAGERIKFSIVTDGSYEVYSNLPVSGDELLTSKQGSYYIIAATETGQVVKKDIEVREGLDFRIKEVKKPENVKCGENFNISFVIESLGEKYFEIETQQSNELRYVPKKYIRIDGGEKTVFLETMLSENCTGRSQFLSVVVNDQRIFEKIETEKNPDFFGQISGFFKGVLNIILDFLD